jgi:CHAT domain-containing protein
VAEAKEIQDLTGARLLMNSVATKRALTSFWEDVGFFVVSAHFVRDPETPYLTFLPLARDPEHSDPDAAYLDLTDVRRADLSGCALVVLSGCASGAPYSDTAVWGPGLGDAFLDAGAGSVIQTFWQVRDLQSRKLVTEWAHAWATGKSPVEALCAVRRKVYAESGLTLPFSWAAYAIELGGL